MASEGKSEAARCRLGRRQTQVAQRWVAAAIAETLPRFPTARAYNFFGSKPVSSYTGRRTLEWRETGGKGVIYAYTVVRIPGPGLEGRLPLCVATVELDEGVRIIANIVNCAPEQMAIGKRVVLAWDPLTSEQNYPAFQLA